MDGFPSTNAMRRLLLDLGAEHPPSLDAIRLVACCVGSRDGMGYWELSVPHPVIREAIAACKGVGKNDAIKVFAQALKTELSQK